MSHTEPRLPSSPTCLAPQHRDWAHACFALPILHPQSLFFFARAAFLAALKTRLSLILAKAVAMRVMINATGCPAPVSDRNRTHTHKHLSQLIELAIDHDIPTPV